MNPHLLAAWVTAFFLSSVLFSHTVALRLLLLLLGTALLIVAVVTNRQPIRIVPPIWLPFALWAAWVAISLMWSQELDRSLKEFQNEIGYTALALWMCFVGAQARDAAKIILPIVATGAALVAALGVYYFPNGFSRYGSGSHGGSGNLSSALLTLMPCVLMTCWLAARLGWARRIQIAGWSLVVLLLVSAHTTLNRTIWIGFAVQLLLIGGIMAARRRKLLDLRAKIIGAAVAVAIVVGGSAMVWSVHKERETIGAAREFSNDPRLELWAESVKLIEEHPLVGYGFGRGPMRKALREELKDPALWHAHNIVLETLIELGLPGLVLLLLLLGAIVREGWRLARDDRDAAVACGIALIAVVAGMLIRNMTDILWLRQNALLFWGVVGVLLAMGQRYRSHSIGC